jgi:hypothetical protein
MTLKDIKARVMEMDDIYVKELMSRSVDGEILHGLEDELKDDFIKWLSEEGTNIEIKLMAKEIMKINDMDFPHWYS